MTGDEGVTWLAEDLDIDDPAWAPGTFSGYANLPAGRQELSRVPLETALKWARECAEVVLIRLADSEYFSAGIRNIDPPLEPLPPDLTVERRRMPGLEMLDNAPGDPPVLWDARVHVPPYSVDRQALRERVSRDRRSAAAPADALAAPNSAIRFFLLTSTKLEAEEIGNRVAREALNELRIRGEAKREALDELWLEVVPHAPDVPHYYG